MWTCGALLVGVGIFGDYYQWWSSKPFLTNLVSALTGAFFGIPFVLLVLQRITDHQAEQLEKKHVQRLAERASRQFMSSVKRITGPTSGYDDPEK